MAYTQRPTRVGIIAMETYFPRFYVDQNEFEKSEGVGQGKYTIGLGQHKMAFVDDREDINSISLTAVSNLMRKYNVSYKNVGRMEVASETIQDHSKSIKSFLMQLFEGSGNTSVEGIDSMHACYAGTNALFNSIAWVESSDWDGRLALVVAADIAEYARGPARPTGGCGAVAFLVGPNAPIAFEPGCRSTHMENQFDFFKPNLDSPYPQVDGKLSNVCFLRALDICYSRFTERYERTQNRIPNGSRRAFSVDGDADYAIFHCPYLGLVKKAFNRLIYNDYLRFPNKPSLAEFSEFKDVSLEESYTHRGLVKASKKIAAPLFKRSVEPWSHLNANLGNCYTAAIFAGLISLVHSQGAKLAGKRILIFSYGSGIASSMYSFKVGTSASDLEQLDNMSRVTNLHERLEDRTAVPPQKFHETLELRENSHIARSFKPVSSIDSMKPGTFYLTEKDDFGRRHYAQIPLSDSKL